MKRIAMRAVKQLALIVSVTIAANSFLCRNAVGQNQGKPTAIEGVRVGTTQDGKNDRYYVSPGTDLIQKVLDTLAKSGDTIVLEPGVHRTSKTIEISKPVKITRRLNYNGLAAFPYLQMVGDRPSKPVNVIDSMFRVDATKIGSGEKLTLIGLRVDLSHAEAGIVVKGQPNRSKFQGGEISIENCRFEGGAGLQHVVLFDGLNGWNARVVRSSFEQNELKESGGLITFQNCTNPTPNKEPPTFEVGDNQWIGPAATQAIEKTPNSLIIAIYNNEHIDPYIEFFCQAGYVAEFEISYVSEGKTFNAKASLSAGSVKRFALPADASSIKAKGRTKGLGSKNIFELEFDSPPNQRIKVYGTIFRPKYVQE